LHLTHEHLAHMLGVRRVSITLAAGELREEGLLHYHRGRLHILDLPALMRVGESP
jgi:CRP-like cAMP-binding protein